MRYEKKLILDTCALLWIARGDNRFSTAARDAIQHASVVYVSAISAWEISLKCERKQQRLPLDSEG